MNYEVIIRKETVAERRLKRQLRRFITLAATALDAQLKPKTKYGGEYRTHMEYRQSEMWFRLQTYPMPRIPAARTTQEKHLRSLYKLIQKYVKDTSKAWRIADLTQARFLMQSAKQVLHDTRLDKEM